MYNVALAAIEGISSHEHSERREVSSDLDSLAPTIFHEAWWLDAATDGDYRFVEVASAGRTLGRLPFLMKRRMGLKMIRMPELTYFLGPAIEEGKGTQNSRFLKRLEITRELLNKLPSSSSQYIKCHGGITDAIAFQECGFRTHVQFTFELKPKPVDELWKQMRDKVRNHIRNARKQLTVEEMADPEEFVRLFDQNLALRGVQNELSPSLCKKIIAAAINRKRGRILAAYDQNKSVVAANVCVWDNNASYYLLCTRAVDSGSHAVSLLIWASIQDAASRNLIFDFGGLGSTGSVRLYSGFGGTTGCRYVAARTTFLARTVLGAKALFLTENCFY